jgi:SAM-dependent methyltransferase
MSSKFDLIDSPPRSEAPLPVPVKPDFQYMGKELDNFADANNWKSYVHSKLREYLIGDVLEVGAGIGGTTKAFNDGSQRRWVCLEPDSGFVQRLKSSVLPRNCKVIEGMMPELDPLERFDAILYMDVLEHIEDDVAELAVAAQHLKPSGALVILSPALPWLYSEFDEAIGHFRRYTKESLRAVFPQGMHEVECTYLDSLGVLASAGNRLLLHSTDATRGQMRFWDGVLVPISRVMDGAIGHAFGRSVLAIWRKNS